MGNKSECEAEYLAQKLTELCPRAPGELLWALRWLYEHREAAALLCGQGKTEAWALCSGSSSRRAPPPIWPWRVMPCC